MIKKLNTNQSTAVQRMVANVAAENGITVLAAIKLLRDHLNAALKSGGEK